MDATPREQALTEAAEHALTVLGEALAEAAHDIATTHDGVDPDIEDDRPMLEVEAEILDRLMTLLSR